MKRLSIFLLWLGGLILIMFIAPGGAQYQIQCVNDECVAAARGSLQSSFLMPLFGALILLLPHKDISPNPIKPVGVLRRFGALCIDLFVFTLTFAPLSVLLVLVVEAMHTGAFQWQFHREFLRETDRIVGFIGTFPIIGGIVYYYYRSLLADRPTLGQYLAGYQIASKEEVWSRSKALKRIGYAILSLCVWPIAAIMAARHKEKAFWWDLKTESIAERFAYVADEGPPD